jgi:hypothetical protein
MATDITSDKTLRMSLAFMALLVLVLGLRSQKTVTSVLTLDHASHTASVQTPTGDLDLVRIDERDRRIAEAKPTGRDPFLQRETKPRTVKVPVELREVLAPSLGALLYDNVNPSAQISIEGERSEWLRQGDEFKGWTIKSITPESVTITKGRDTIVLS